MTTPTMQQDSSPQTELRFVSLFNEGRGYAFPCDAAGHVNIDELSRVARQNYLYARTCIGREFRHPVVQRVGH